MPKVSVGALKKSIAAIASRWLRKNVSQPFVGSGGLGARRQPAGDAAQAVRDHTDSDHGLEIYMNLARRMTVTAFDQLWIATSPTFGCSQNGSTWR